MKLYVEDIQNLPAIIVQQDGEPAPSGYTEKNTIEDWYNYGQEVLDEYFGFNYLTWRSEILGLIIAIVQPDYSQWANLSPEEKDIACELILAPYNLRILTVSDEEDKTNWTELVIKSQGISVQYLGGRAQIVEQMREAVSEWYRVENISKDDVDDFYRTVFTLVEWFKSANTPDFKQWLTNEVGSPYENDGFAQKSYYTVARKDELHEIYKGNY